MAALRWVSSGSAALVLSLGLALGGSSASLADRISLRGGGQIRGKVIADERKADRVFIVTESGKTPLSFQKAQILQVVPEPSVLDEYVPRRNAAAQSAEAQHELGIWCAEHKLADLAEVHFEAAVAADPAFAPAHQKLGHVRVGGRWLGGDALREAQGLVKYKGRWITKEERDAREAEAASAAEKSSWARRIRLLRDAIAGGTETRAKEAEQQLLAIREPIAVGPLVGVLGQDLAFFRMLLDQVLGTIPGPEAAQALVRRVLGEPDNEVRQATMTELERRTEPNVVPNLVKALGSSRPEVVNRAAWALASLHAVATVPRLIPALITTQYRMVLVPQGGGSPAGGLGLAGPPGVPAYYNGSSLGLLTGPVVGPGVAAYGATSVVPYLPYSGSSLSVGGSVSSTRGPVFRLMAYSYQNVEVHAALVNLTGRDFGYDIPTWKRWVSTSFRANANPARRVPQP